MPLTSTKNPLLQKVRRAVVDGRPMEGGCVAAEGPNLLAEALRGTWAIEHIFCSGEGRERHSALIEEAAGRRIQVSEVAARAFEQMSGTEKSQGVLCLMRPRLFGWADLLEGAGPVVILDGIQDPGNAGAIVRSTEAFDGAGVVLTDECVRVSNGKFLRAAAGSMFRVPYLENVPRGDVAHHLSVGGRTVFGLAAEGEDSLFKTVLTGRIALVVGSEGGGVSAMLMKVSRTLSIPTRGVESLNAGIACSLALFEAARQSEARGK
jgi:TrmH family RNA methyltransferase